MYCLFPFLWILPNQLILAMKFLSRHWDVHLNWSLMFTHHFPVGSDSLRLLSASSSFLLVDTSRLAYLQEADVFSCWSHSVLLPDSVLKWNLVIYFQMLPDRISSWDTCVIFEGDPGGLQLLASRVAWGCQDLPSVIWWCPFSPFRLQFQIQFTL